MSKRLRHACVIIVETERAVTLPSNVAKRISNTSFNNSGLFLHIPVCIPFDCTYRRVGVDGQPARTRLHANNNCNCTRSSSLTLALNAQRKIKWSNVFHIRAVIASSNNIIILLVIGIEKFRFWSMEPPPSSVYEANKTIHIEIY